MTQQSTSFSLGSTNKSDPHYDNVTQQNTTESPPQRQHIVGELRARRKLTLGTNTLCGLLSLIFLWPSVMNAQSTALLCLDFNGHVIPRWEIQDQLFENIDIPPYNHPNSDATTLSADEKAAVNRIVEAVVEDFSPFDITVITEELPVAGGTAH